MRARRCATTFLFERLRNAWHCNIGVSRMFVEAVISNCRRTLGVATPNEIRRVSWIVLIQDRGFGALVLSATPMQ